MKKITFTFEIIVLLAFLGFGVFIYYVSFYKQKDLDTAPIIVEFSGASDCMDGYCRLPRKVIESKIQKAFGDAIEKGYYRGQREAQDVYDKNIATLLTILTLFGIAWPLVVSMLQFKLNERELNKVEEAREKADDLKKQIEQKVSELKVEMYSGLVLLILTAGEQNPDEETKNILFAQALFYWIKERIAEKNDSHDVERGNITALTKHVNSMTDKGNELYTTIFNACIKEAEKLCEAKQGTRNADVCQELLKTLKEKATRLKDDKKPASGE